MTSAPLRDAGPIDGFWAVVPAGGAGTRLWPLSRRAAPKFLRDLTGTGRSLLQQTRDRLEPLCEDRFLVVTGRSHTEAVQEQLCGPGGLDPDAVLAEPSARDSMAAIGLAAAVLERRDPDAVLGSFAADHVIGDVAAFGEAVRNAVEVAREDYLVTVGIDPTGPATGFGYVRLGVPLPGHAAAYAVQTFVEKPSVDLAREYVAGGDYRWNAGMFVVRPRVLLDLLGRWHPDFARALRDLAASEGGPGSFEEALEAGWDALPRIALDHAVAEPAAAAGRVAIVPAGFGWDDVGDFDSLATLLPRGEEGVAVLGERAQVVVRDSTGVVVPASGRLVAVVGLEDVVVVDTDDALLVTTRARAQEVKEVVAALTRAGRDDLT